MTPTVVGEPTLVRAGRRLSVAVSTGDGPTVLFLHGSGGNKDQWRTLWGPLAGTGPRLVAWDAPGHGASPDLRRPDAYATEALVEDALALLGTHARGGPAVLVGHSYGVVVTLALLVRLAADGRLGEIAGVLLFGPPPPGVDFAAGPLATMPLRQLRRLRPQLERGFRENAWGPDVASTLVDYEEGLTRRNRLWVMQRLWRGARSPDAATLSVLDLPVSVVAGADDRLTPPAGAEALVAALPRGTLTVLTRCGHQIMLERPDESLRALRALL